MSPAVLRELTVDAPAAHEDAVVAAVYRMGVQGLEVRDADTGPRDADTGPRDADTGPRDADTGPRDADTGPRDVDTGGAAGEPLAADPGRVRIVAWLPPSPAASRAIRGLRRRLQRLGPDLRCTWRDVPITWEPEPPATPVGARFVVLAPSAAPAAAPSAAPVPPREDGRIPLVLDGHLAFGDGLHPTTILCVEALERRYADGAGPRSVLDVGTGTGILALVAARLGGEGARVVAQDIDPLALFATRQHVAANGAAVEVVEVLPAGPFALVVANLYFAPLLALIPALAARVAPKGELVLSGFGGDARDRVEAACVAAGLHVREVREREGWGLLAATR